MGRGAHRHARGRAVGQREGRSPRRLWGFHGPRYVRRQLRLRVPAGFLRRFQLPQDLLELFNSHPAQVGQLPHAGKLLEKRLQGHFAFQELLGHFLEEERDISTASLYSSPLLRIYTSQRHRGKHRTTHKQTKGNPNFWSNNAELQRDNP